MKKGFIKSWGALTLSAVLAVSTVSYAAETELFQTENEAGFTAETEGTAAEEENGLNAFVVVRKKTEEGFSVRKISKEEIGQEALQGNFPEMAAVVFELTEEEKQAAEQKSIEIEEDTNEDRAGFFGIEEETEVFTSETKDYDSENIPVVTLTEMQKALVYEVAELVPQTVVLFNQCMPEDALIFKDCVSVKAVKWVDAEDEKAVLTEIENFELEKEFEKYLEMKERGDGSSLLRSSSRTITGGTGGTENQPDSETDTSANRAALSGSTSTQKDVTITLVPEEFLEGEDLLMAGYVIKSSKQITSGKITVTYDTDLMTYEDSDAGYALDDMMVSMKTPGDDGVQEGKIEMEFTSTTGQIMDDTFIDLWFNLKEEAQRGKVYNINLTVDYLRNGSTDLTSEVKESRITPEEDPDTEEQTESQTTPETTPSTTAQTPSTQALAAQTPVNAPKTGDETNIIVFLAAILGSAVIFNKARKRA